MKNIRFQGRDEHVCPAGLIVDGYHASLPHSASSPQSKCRQQSPTIPPGIREGKRMHTVAVTARELLSGSLLIMDAMVSVVGFLIRYERHIKLPKKAVQYTDFLFAGICLLSLQKRSTC